MMNQRIVKWTVLLCLAITGVVCAVLLRQGSGGEAGSAAGEAAASGGGKLGGHESVSVQNTAPGVAGGSAVGKKGGLPDGVQALGGEVVYQEHLDLGSMFKGMRAEQLEEIAGIIELSDEERAQMLALLEKHGVENFLAGVAVVQVGNGDADVLRAEAEVGEDVLDSNGGLFKEWYQNEEFMADALSALDKERGEKLVDRANKLDYLDRDSRSTNQVNEIQRRMDVSQDEARALKELYMEKSRPQAKELEKVLGAERAQQAQKLANNTSIDGLGGVHVIQNPASE